MFSLTIDNGPRDGSNLRRRDLLRIGTLALGGLSLPQVLAVRARASGNGLADTVREKSVVFLFLAGGPSHIETFDPRMDTPEGVRSVTGEVSTSLPGITFGGTFPGLAARAHKLAIVRSFHHAINDHVKAIQHLFTAGNPLDASAGALYARLRGATDPDTAMPTTGLVSADEVDPQYRNERSRVQAASGPGLLGTAYTPFDPSSGQGALDLMRLRIPRQRLEDRRGLLRTLDEARRSFEQGGTIESLSEYERQAFDLILRDAGSALDLTREDPRLVARYDTSGFLVGHKKKRPCSLGRQLLMARRLVELGCGFVTVQNAGWDMHADVNNPGIEDGMRMLGAPLDHAVSAFLDDLDARGLSDRVLLVITGDFGRTPRINKRGGRDHWASLSTLALAGGGLPMGQVIGRSSRAVDVPGSDPVTPQMLLATLLHLLFDVPRLRLLADVPGEISALLNTAEPIRGLF